MAASKKTNTSQKVGKTQTYPDANAAVRGAKKRGEPTITFKLDSKKKAK